MAITCDYNKKTGEITMNNWHGEPFTVNLYKSNALLCAVYEYTDDDGDDRAQLVDFIVDTAHAKNMLGLNPKQGYTDNKYDGTWVKLELNAEFKDRDKLVQLIAKAHWEHPMTIVLS